MSLLIAAVVGLAMAAPGIAAAPGPSVEVAGESAVEGSAPALQMEAVEGEPTETTLRVPLLIRRAGRLQVEYIETATGKHLDVGPRSDETGVSIVGRLPRRAFPAGQILVLSLRFVTSPGHEKELPGLISVRTTGGVPLVRRVEAPSSEAAEPSPTQQKVEIAATRWIPFVGTPEASATVGIVGAEEAAGSSPLAESRLTFNHGGHAAVTVESPSGEGTIRSSKIRVTDASGVGSASTVVDLGEEEKAAQQLEVVVTVGDSFIAPLIVVFIGALLGKLLPTLFDTRRQRKELQAALLEAREGYDDALAAADRWKDGKQVKLPTFDPKLGWRERVDTDALLTQLESFRRPSQLEKDSEKAENFINALKGWVVVVEAMRLLAEKVEAPDPAKPVKDAPARPPAPLLDSEILLRQGFEISSDLTKWTDVAAAIQGQALILEDWDQVAARRAAGDGASESSPGLAAYEAAKPPLVRSQDEIELLLAALRRELFVLESGPEPADQPAYLTIDPEALLATRAEFSFRPGTPLARLVPVARPPKARTPASIMASVRRGDWLLAIGTFLISSLAYLLPIYGGGPFGTWQQYLGAFAAGAGGQVLVSTVIPWARSYKLSPTAQPTTAPPTTS